MGLVIARWYLVRCGQVFTIDYLIFALWVGENLKKTKAAQLFHKTVLKTEGTICANELKEKLEERKLQCYIPVKAKSLMSKLINIIMGQRDENKFKGQEKELDNVSVTQRWKMLKKTLESAMTDTMGFKQDEKRTEWYNECHAAVTRRNRAREMLQQKATRASIKNFQQ
ncbi:hypothetical protein ANN_17432 [Periplaneta americana]|uniref:Uncharacterized protein n=1 Tax=Periplaneta americana TaxID=6978 RepID=A0ABQ8ST04_PERAM|nr:hypothetical protein ANN_17432 [Periplaneta americana]